MIKIAFLPHHDTIMIETAALPHNDTTKIESAVLPQVMLPSGWTQAGSLQHLPGLVCKEQPLGRTGYVGHLGQVVDRDRHKDR